MQYKSLVELYEKLEGTTKRLEKTHYLSEFLKKVKKEELDDVVQLAQGRIFPAWDERKIGVAARIVLKAIAAASGISADKVEKEWKKTGDLGLCASNLIKNKKQHTLFSKSLTAEKVLANLRKLTELEGEGTVDKKVQLISELLTSAGELEAKYIVRTVLEELRIGLGEGTLRDAIVWCYFGDKFKLRYDNKEVLESVGAEDREKLNEYTAKVQHMIDIMNDYAEVASLIAEKGEHAFKATGITIGKPLKVMLAQKADDIKDAFEKVGKPAEFEYKYDGFRMQIHKSGKTIKLFTRRLEEVTGQFPDVVSAVKEHVEADNFILDSEVLGIDLKSKRFLPFQNISQRIRRKYEIEEMTRKIPVAIELFDAIVINDQNLLDLPLKERKRLLKEIIKPKKDKIELAKSLVTDNQKEAEAFYKESLDKGNEGIMAKNMESVYKPGSRVGFMLKIKPTMENLDLVITGAQWGEGKRSKWLSSFTLSCRGSKKGEYLEVGKVGTGIKELEVEERVARAGKSAEAQEKAAESEDVSFEELTKMLKPLIIEEKGMEVKIKPRIVVEIAYNEIQESTNYNSGYALRFPRLVRLRPDRSAEDAADVKMVKDFAEGQLKQKK